MKIDGIPDDLNELTFVKEAPDLTTLIKGAAHAQSMIGNSIRIPGEGASDADKADFKSKLERVGMVPKDKFTEYVRPEKPEQYELKAPPVGADKVVTQQDIDGWKKTAHALGLAPAQFEAFATDQINARIEAAKQQALQFGEVDSALKAKFGEAGLSSAKQRALAAAFKFGGQALVDQLATAPNAQTLIALAEVGKLFQERGMGDLTPQESFPMSPAEAATRRAEIRANKDHPFNRPQHEVGRQAKQAAMDEMMRLRYLSEGQRPPAAGKDLMFDEEVA